MQGSGKPIVVVGSINMDLVATAEHIPLAGETIHASGFHTYPGGKGANQAVAAARLGYPVKMVGMLGADSFGADLRKALVASGVDVGEVGVTDGPSGVAMIVVAASGENSIAVNAGANARLTPEYLDAKAGLLRGAGAVLTQLEIPLETVVRLSEICREAGVPLILDPAPAAPLPQEILEGTRWFTPNETEAAFFAGLKGEMQDNKRVADALFARGIGGVILKQGAKGAYLGTPDGWSSQVDAFQVKAVDTTAAGDAFNGAFAVGLMLGREPAESARFAAAAAAISVTRAGAQASMPDRGEVEKLLQQHADVVSRG